MNKLNNFIIKLLYLHQAIPEFQKMSYFLNKLGIS